MTCRTAVTALQGSASAVLTRITPKFTLQRAIVVALLAVLALAYQYVTRVYVFRFEPLPRVVMTPMVSSRSANFFTTPLTAAALLATNEADPEFDYASRFSRAHWTSDDYDTCARVAITPLFQELTAVATNFHSTGVGGVRHFGEQRRAMASVLVHTMSAVLWERNEAIAYESLRGRGVNLRAKLNVKPKAGRTLPNHNETQTGTHFAPTPFKICEMGFGAGHSAALFLSAADCFLRQGHKSSLAREVDVSMVSFDMCRWGFEAEALKMVNQHAFPPRQPLSLISGDATTSVPGYLQMIKHQNPRPLLANAHAQAFPHAHEPHGESESRTSGGTRMPVDGDDVYASWDALENAGQRCDFMLYDVHELGYGGLNLFRSLARRPPPGVSAATATRTASTSSTSIEFSAGGEKRKPKLRVWRPSILAMDWCESDRTTELAYQRALSTAVPGGGWMQEIGCAIDQSDPRSACALKFCFARIYLD